MRVLACVLLVIALSPTLVGADSSAARLVGSGRATISTGGECSTPGAILIQIDLDGYGLLAFPQTSTAGCGGYANAWVKECQREGAALICAGSNPVRARFTLTDDGTAEYVAAWLNGTTFRAAGTIAYSVIVVPSQP